MTLGAVHYGGGRRSVRLTSTNQAFYGIVYKMAQGIELLSADFFVHPDFHRFGGDAVDDQVVAYEQALHDRIDGSSLPILMQNPSTMGQGDFAGRFNPDLTFTTQEANGVIGRGQILRLNKLLEGLNVGEATVHGSYLTKCVRTFMHALHNNRHTGAVEYNRQFGRLIPGTVTIGTVLNDQKVGMVAALGRTYHPYTDKTQIFHTDELVC